MYETTDFALLGALRLGVEVAHSLKCRKCQKISTPGTWGWMRMEPFVLAVLFPVRQRWCCVPFGPHEIHHVFSYAVYDINLHPRVTRGHYLGHTVAAERKRCCAPTRP